MKDLTKSFLGNGWAFPPAFNKYTNSVEMVSGVTDIEQSIRIILGTIPGERVMYPSFGCGINTFVFETSDVTHITMLKDTIYDALLFHEPRIKVEKIEVVEDEPVDGLLKIYIEFSVIITNSRSNIVYPFYLKEGTNI
jgi:phage baseplate assembly protein W